MISTKKNLLNSFQIENEWSCGATILNDHFLLTARSCCETISRSNFQKTQLFIGDYFQLEMFSDSGRPIRIEQTIPHQNLDACLIQTRRSMMLDGVLTDIVCLPDKESDPDGKFIAYLLSGRSEPFFN